MCWWQKTKRKCYCKGRVVWEVWLKLICAELFFATWLGFKFRQWCTLVSRLDRAKVQAIGQYPPPTTKMIWWDEFVWLLKGFLLKLFNYCSAVWSPFLKKAFESVKAIFCDSPSWLTPPMGQSFKLQVDASHMGPGGVLLQEDDFGIDKPVSIFSKRFNKHQLNWSYSCDLVFAAAGGVCRFRSCGHLYIAHSFDIFYSLPCPN